MDINKTYEEHSLRIASGVIVLAVLLLADGAVATTQISACTTISSPGEYILDQYISNTSDSSCINITSSNVIFDGAGYTIDGINKTYGNGVYVYNSTTVLTNVTVKNLDVTDWNEGIYYINTENGSIIENNAWSNFGGIRLDPSSNNTLSGNNASENIFGIILSTSSNNILSRNIASNNFFGIHVASSSNNILNGNIASNNNHAGIYLYSHSNNNTLNGNNVSRNREGINLDYSNNNNTLSGNNASKNIIGIVLSTSSNNILNGNIASNNNCYGTWLRSSGNNILNGNIASNNACEGINLSFSSNNTLSSNIVSNNGYGIRLVDSRTNIIYNNYFNNTYNFESGDNNIWNFTKNPGMNIVGGPYIGGNFWANPSGTGFSQTCVDANRDEICDSPYTLNANNTDYLPLATSYAPYVPSEMYGMKFNDSNGNRIMDAGESGISGVEIHLIRMIVPGVENLEGTAFTNLSGNYNFTGLSPGFYRVEELPGDFVQTFPENGMPHFIELEEGDIKTGIDFGNRQIIPGEIHGIKFNDSNANGLLDDEEFGISGVSICLSPSWRCNTTDISGNYSFPDVSPGNYTVYENLPPELVATTPMLVEIVINSSEVKVINFGSRLPVPPPEDVSVEQQSGEQNGVPTVFRPALTVLTISKNLTNISENVVSVNLTLNWSDGTTRTESMVEIGSTNVWSANFSAPFPGGTSQMIFKIDVAPAGQGPEDAIQIGDIIFIDPSGVIKDAYNGNSISNATVTLLIEYPPETNNFIVSPPENQIPSDNPVITGGDGRYSWLTIPGTYKVRAEKAGYITAESDNVTVPPIVTDLNISLIPILPDVRFINGTIIDSVNRIGIAGVKVSTNTSNSTITNASGFYSLSVASGTYNITSTFEPTYYTNSTIVSTAFSAVVIQDVELIKKLTGNISGSIAAK